jgi:hypothetical protein
MTNFSKAFYKRALRTVLAAAAFALIAPVFASDAHAQFNPFGSPSTPSSRGGGSGGGQHAFGSRDTAFGAPAKPSARSGGSNQVASSGRPFGGRESPFGSPSSHEYAGIGRPAHVASTNHRPSSRHNRVHVAKVKKSGKGRMAAAARH